MHNAHQMWHFKCQIQFGHNYDHVWISTWLQLSAASINFGCLQTKLTLYFVSRLPATFPLSMLEDPPEVNSTPVSVLVFTCRIWWWGWGLGLREIIDTSSNCYLKFEKTKMVALAKNIWGLLAQISVLWRAHCCSRVLQEGRTVMERSWSTLIGLVCREHSAKK